MSSSPAAASSQEQNHLLTSEQSEVVPRASLINDEPLRAAFEILLMLGGLLAMLLFLPHGIFGDGAVRYQAIAELLQHGTLSNMQYSLVGPAFSIPLWFAGLLYKTPDWWLARYNLGLFALSLLLLYLLLRNRLDRGLLRKFFLILIVGSMFANQLSAYYGEVFTALCVASGIFLFASGRGRSGWSLIALGVVNTPASIAGLICMALQRAFQDKRLRYLLIVVVAAAFIVLEYTIRRGSFFKSYEPPPNPAFHTVMPYSGLRGFSYPFFFGLLSILFSFGKGLLFFVPGLLLPARRLIRKVQLISKLDLSGVYLLSISFVIGLVLVYAPWWAWYGGWFWGPRFFLFACIPAALVLALRLHYRYGSLAGNVLTCAVLLLSTWVGIDGAIFDQRGLGICVTHFYALELLCHYTPEYSALWHPFVANEFATLDSHQWLYLLYSLFVCVYLVLPLLWDMFGQTKALLGKAGSVYLKPSLWRL